MKGIKKVRKLIAEAREHFEAELSICQNLREKGERTRGFPIEEYQRGHLNATDALNALKNISEALKEVRP